MSPSYEQLRDAALALPPEERLKLADMLAVSLRRSEQEWELAPDFVAELNRRSSEMDEDPATEVPWDDVLAEMEKPVAA